MHNAPQHPQYSNTLHQTVHTVYHGALSEFQVLHIFSKCLTFPHLLNDCFNAGHSESFFMCSISDSLLFILVLNSIHWWGLIFWQLLRIFTLHDLGLFICKFCCLGIAAFFRSLSVKCTSLSFDLLTFHLFLLQSYSTFSRMKEYVLIYYTII